MNGVDIILIVLLSAVLILAVRRCIRNKKHGRTSCGGNCASCSGCGRSAS